MLSHKATTNSTVSNGVLQRRFFRYFSIALVISVDNTVGDSFWCSEDTSGGFLHPAGKNRYELQLDMRLPGQMSQLTGLRGLKKTCFEIEADLT